MLNYRDEQAAGRYPADSSERARTSTGIIPTLNCRLMALHFFAISPDVPLCSCARNMSSVCRTQKLTTGKLSCAIFPYLEVFCFLFIHKWNEYRFFGRIVFMCLKRVLCAENPKINHRRTELCNIPIFGGILLPVQSEVE
jgi:hypothetical protein